MSIQEKITDLIVDQLGVDKEKVKPEASFVDDLGADSMDIVELVMTLEEKFSIQIPDQEEGNIRTVQDAIDFIKENQKPEKNG